MNRLLCLTALLLTTAAARAQMSAGTWTPIFKGIDYAVGTNRVATTVTTPIPGGGSVVWTNSRLQSVRMVRVDLSDADVALFATPRASNYVAGSRETLSLSVSNFVKNNGLAVGANAGFYTASPGGGDPSSEGVPCQVYGLQMCTGVVVSAAEAQNRYASLLFTTNKQPTIVWTNTPPGTNTTGMFTAVTGYYPLLTNGVNVWAIYSNQLAVTYNDPSIHSEQPRTAYGLSANRRYLFLMVIDGRQSGYSTGAIDRESGQWMLLFGAADAINMDGGGSSAMYMSDCATNPVPLSHSSLAAAIGRDRYVGSHLGVRALPLPTFITSLAATPGSTNAIISWTTASNATSQVEYGLTAALGTLSSADPTLVTNHSLTLTGLTAGTLYYYRAISIVGGQQYTKDACRPLQTTNVYSAFGSLLSLTDIWKYNVANMDSVPSWKTASFNDSGWPSGAGVLWIDTTYAGGHSDIKFLPLRTSLPTNTTTYPYTNYYFRTRFVYSNTLTGVALIFSNYLDDGAVFYLNGTEIQRPFMPAAPAVINNSTFAASFSCSPSGNAICPCVFTITGDLTTNLVFGTNVLAVEVHNKSATSPDVTFGCALLFAVPPQPAPPAFISNLAIAPGETNATINWTTLSNSTSQVQYGPTTNLVSVTPLDSALVTNHSVTLTGLARTNGYYFTVISTVGATPYTASGVFSTVPFYRSILALTNEWSYSTNNLDSVPAWKTSAYNDSSWSNDNALFWVDLRAFPNPDVQPKFTGLSWNTAGGAPWTTYAFRTRFTLTNPPASGFTLVLSNFVDAGAVFYLNGAEIQRLRLPPAPTVISNATFATGEPATGDAETADVLRLWGNSLTNLIVGTNLLAVEVHNISSTNLDLTFGSAVGWARALASETKLRIAHSNHVARVAWDGAYLTLQQSGNPASTNSWSDVPGPITTSPYSVTNPAGAIFYRLRN